MTAGDDRGERLDELNRAALRKHQRAAFDHELNGGGLAAPALLEALRRNAEEVYGAAAPARRKG